MQPQDRVRLKKKHPCGGDTFVLLRVASQVRMRCESCGRVLTLSRIDAEKKIKEIL